MGQKLKVPLSFLPADKAIGVRQSNSNKQWGQQIEYFIALNQEEQDKQVMQHSSDIKTIDPGRYYSYISELEAIADEVNSIQVLKKDEKKNDKLWNATPVTSDIEGDVRKAFKLLKRCGFIKGDIKVNSENGEIEMELEDNPENVVEGVVCGDIFEAGAGRGHYNYLLFRVLYAIKHSEFGQKLHLIKGNHDLYTGAGPYKAKLYSELDYYKKMIYPYLENRWIKEVEETNPENPNEKKKVFFVFQHAFFTDNNGELKKQLGEDYDDYKKLGNDNSEKSKWREENCCLPYDTESYDRLLPSKRKGYYNSGNDVLYQALGYFPSIDTQAGRALPNKRFTTEDLQSRLATLVNNLQVENPNGFQDLTTDNIRLVFGHEHSKQQYYPEGECDDKSKNIFMVDTYYSNAGDVYEIPANAFKQHGENHYYGAMLSVEGGRPEQSQEREEAYEKNFNNKLAAKGEAIKEILEKIKKDKEQQEQQAKLENEEEQEEIQDTEQQSGQGEQPEKAIISKEYRRDDGMLGDLSKQENSTENNLPTNNNVDNLTSVNAKKDNLSKTVSKRDDNTATETILTTNKQTNEPVVIQSDSSNDKKTNPLYSSANSFNSNITTSSYKGNASTIGYGDVYNNKQNVMDNNQQKKNTGTNNTKQNIGNNNQNFNIGQENQKQNEKSFALPIVTGTITIAGGIASVLSFADVIKGIPVGGKIVMAVLSVGLGAFTIGYSNHLNQENKKINNQNTNLINKNDLNKLQNQQHSK